MPALDLRADVVELAGALVDTPSVSGEETALADAVEAALRGHAPALTVERHGDAVLARTDLGRPARVLLAGHLDTVPIAGNVPGRRAGDRLLGCGASDMKSGLAVMLRLAPHAADGEHDLTFCFYDAEEVDAARNGLGRIRRSAPEWLAADLAVLMEPTSGTVEAGCQGTLRVAVDLVGRRAHTARAWVGSNAIHAAAGLLLRLSTFTPRVVEIDGCTYREGLQAVRIEGGVAGNVVPDACTIIINHRFAPDRTVEQGIDAVREALGVEELRLLDSAPGALPGLGSPLAQRLVDAVGRPPVAKLGWTDVSRFAAMGTPALNYGPGDPLLAHMVEESVEVHVIVDAERVMRRFLGLPAAG